nr:alginate lyase family protein [uncultured Pseudoxanthomonas sp.]
MNEHSRRSLVPFLVMALAMVAMSITSFARETGTTSMKLSDVMSYGMWFRSSQGGDRTREYAEQLLAGRFKPRRDVDYWEFSYPIDWVADPYKEDNWQFLLHSLYMLDPLLVAEDEDKDERYMKAALRIVADWHAFHLIRKGSAKYSWYNMAVGMRSAKIAYIHSRLRDQYPHLLDASTQSMFDELAESHVAPVIGGDIPLRMTNHGLFQVHGVMAICREFEGAAVCRDSKNFVADNLDRIISAQFDDEGMHLEHSPAYHRFTLNKLDALAATGWYADFPNITRVSKKARANLFWLIDPSGRFWGVGDSIPSEQPGHQELEVPANGCPKELPATGALPDACVVMRQFQSGYVTIRTTPFVPVEQASGLFYQGSFHSSVHKHLDDQSFELFERGDRVIVDSGYYGYMAHPMRRYMLSTRAHNTVELGGKDFSRKDSDAYGSAIEAASFQNGYYRIQGRVEHKNLRTVHSRQLLYKPGNWLVIRDWIGGTPNGQAVQWLHLHPDAVLLKQSRADASFALKKSIFTIKSLSGCDIRVVRGEKSPSIQGWYSPTQGVAIPNYAIGFACQQKPGALEVAIALSEVAEKELAVLLPDLRKRNPLRQ